MTNPGMDSDTQTMFYELDSPPVQWL